MFLDGQEKKDCCGCMACSKVCNLSAITMKQDERGFFYPEVDKTRCVECGMCEKVCPMKENYVGASAELEIYAVCNHDKEVLGNSSSGGVVSLLSRWVLKKQGVMYGVAYDESFSVKHRRATNMEEMNRFQTSKYVESDISEVYEHILTDLAGGKTVLLTGTPCQISALQKYLIIKRADTTNFYTCDNICHGVPSRKVWESYLAILKEKYISVDDQITYINMRNKKDSWKEKRLKISLEKGNIDKLIDEFSFVRFYQSLYGTRTSCFNCKYTSYKRTSDITVGDFLNVEKAGIQFDVSGGVSEVLVNTEKGGRLFEAISAGANFQQISKEDAWQLHLENPSKKPGKQDEFWSTFNEEEDKENVIRKYMNGSFLTRLIRLLTPILQKIGLYDIAGKMYKLVFVERRKHDE